MQTDGNLVIYDGSNRAIWASNTSGHKGNYQLILQRDRNVVIYDSSNRAIWATSSNIPGTAPVVISENSANKSPVGAWDKIPRVTGK